MTDSPPPPASPAAVPMSMKDTGAVLKYLHALGSRPTPGRALEHISDDTVLYIAGQHVAAFQWDALQHRFILKSTKTAEIVTFCVSANRKYIALAERLTDGSMQVNIYTQHTGSKVRSLDFKYLSKLPVVAMSFSTDNKYLATVTALPDVFIYLWQVDKARLVGMIDVPYEISKVTISPWSYWTLCTTGPSTLKIWRLVDKQLKPMDVLPRRGKGGAGGGGAGATDLSAASFGGTGGAPGGIGGGPALRFTCHTWYDEDRLVAGTEEGDLLVVEDNETKKIIRSIHGEGLAVTAVQAVARGLLCGGDGGIISMFERTFDDSTYFRHVRRFTASCTSSIVELSIAPKEDNCVVLYKGNQLMHISLEAVDSLKNADSSAFTTPLPVGFHDDEITAVDVCVQKPIIVTGSLDKTLRVWNFMRRKVDFVKTFEEEVLSLAVHPTGLRVVVGFKSYMRMYNILANDLHFCSEFPLKGCREVRFSNGGHAFAAAIAHRVLVFNAYDFRCTAQLSGHTVLLQSLHWSQNDAYLTTADINGILYRWHVDEQRREDTDDSRKNISYTCVRSDDTTGMVAAVGVCRLADQQMSEGEITIRCIKHETDPRIIRPGLKTSRLPASRKQHTAELALCPSAQTLFVGSPTGALLLYHWPLTDDAQPFQTLEVHTGEVQFLTLSRDERFLFTVGSDRSMYMFEVDAMIEGKAVSRKQFNYAAFEDVCYVLQSDMDEKQREVSQLQQQLDDLAVARAREEQTLHQKYEAERTQQETEAQEHIRFLQQQLDDTGKSKDEAERALTDNARQLEAMHLKAAEELEALYAKRSEEATARYQQLKMERDDMVVRYENRIFKLQKEQEAERKKLEDRLKDTDASYTADMEALQKNAEASAKVSEDMIDQTIVDYETMLDEIVAKHKSETQRTEEELARAINNGSTGERDAERLRREKQALSAHLSDKDRSIQDLEHAMEKKRKENESLKKEMHVRFESISTAEKKIQQLKKQTSELEKLRYVLTFKFNELKKEVAPKDRQVSLLTQRVEEMDTELERIATDREALKQTLERKEDRLQVLQREIRGQHRGLDDKERIITSLLADLSELLAASDTKKLAVKLQDVVTKFGTHQARTAVLHEGGADNRTAEFERQREYMESQVSCLKRQNRQHSTNLRLDNQRSTSENAVLVKEINDLRHEKKQLATKCSLVEAQLKEARMALQRATAAVPATASATPPLEATPGRARASSQGAVPSSPAVASTAPLRGRGGRLVRGSTRALRDVGQMDADKIARIITQVERNNSEMARQEEEIARLRDFVGHLLLRAEAAPAELSAEERSRHQEIKRHIDAMGAPAAVGAASTDGTVLPPV